MKYVETEGGRGGGQERGAPSSGEVSSGSGGGLVLCFLRGANVRVDSPWPGGANAGLPRVKKFLRSAGTESLWSRDNFTFESCGDRHH